MQITVQRYGTLPQTVLQKVHMQFIAAKDGIKFLAEQTRDHMRNVIKEKTYRPGGSGNLMKSIEAEKIPDGWGVGNISKMNITAPYWYLMNYGGMSTVAARGGTVYGSFGPGNPPDHRYSGTNPGAGSDIFVQNTYPSYPMRPKNPVGAKNYIEITANWLSTVWRVHMSGVTSKKQF